METSIPAGAMEGDYPVVKARRKHMEAGRKRGFIPLSLPPLVPPESNHAWGC